MLLIFRMAFALIKFFEKNQIREGVVPSHWIEEKTVWWPTYKAKQLALNLEPLDKRWPSYPVIDIRKYDGR